MILDHYSASPAVDLSDLGNETSETRPTAQKVNTTRFGTLEVADDLIMTFDEGLIGFERCHRFVTLCPNEQSPLRWLQCLDDASLAFPIIQPSAFRDDYSPCISDADVRVLQLEQHIPAILFAVVTVPMGSAREMTANLIAPLVVNPLTRKGKQVILQDDRFHTKHRVMDEMVEKVTGVPNPATIVKATGRKSKTAA